MLGADGLVAGTQSTSNKSLSARTGKEIAEYSPSSRVTELPSRDGLRAADYSLWVKQELACTSRKNGPFMLINQKDTTK